MKNIANSQKHLVKNELMAIHGGGSCTVYIKPLKGLKDGDPIFADEVVIKVETADDAACQEVQDAGVNNALDQAVTGLKAMGMKDEATSTARELLGPDMGRHEFKETTDAK